MQHDYVQVAVPVKLVPAVYRLVIEQTEGAELPAGDGKTAEPGRLDLDLTQQTVDAGKSFDIRRVVAGVYKRVTPAGRAVMTTLAENSPSELSGKELEAQAAVSNFGAAHQSIAIQLQRYDLGLGDLIEWRRVDGLFHYWMSPEVAEAVLELREGITPND